MIKSIKRAFSILLRIVSLIIFIPLTFVIGTIFGLLLGGALAVKEIVTNMDLKRYILYESTINDV